VTETLKPVGEPDEDRGQPEEARALLMDAAATLFAANSSVSVRAIAKAAGVNHGLVHYYFGSKDQLKRDAYDRVANFEDFAHLTVDSTPAEIVDSLYRNYDHDMRHVYMAMRDLLDGETTLMTGRGFPILERLMQVIAPDDPELSKRTASVLMSSSVAVLLFADYVTSVMGLSREDQLEFQREWQIEMVADARAGRWPE
jgi:AcrR family transcriptional regulator